MIRAAKYWPVVLVLVLAAPFVLRAADAIETYDLDREQVELSVMSAFRGAWYPFDVTDVLRQLPPAARATAVRAIGDVVRGYVGSPQFKKAYIEAYKQSKPKGFGLPSLNARTLADKALEKAQGKPASGDADALDKNPNVTLKHRLEQFLELSADVDFSAATTGEGSERRFVKPEDEARPKEWKMCFRAGPEATAAARAYAKEWLAELEKTPAKK